MDFAINYVLIEGDIIGGILGADDLYSFVVEIPNNTRALVEIEVDKEPDLYEKSKRIKTVKVSGKLKNIGETLAIHADQVEFRQ